MTGIPCLSYGGQADDLWYKDVFNFLDSYDDDLSISILNYDALKQPNYHD